MTGRRLKFGMAALALGILASVAAADDAVKGLAIGSPVPMAGYKLKNVDGSEITLKEVMGQKGTLVVFTCNHCPFAQAWEERIVKLGNEYSTKGIGVIAVNSNDPEVVPDDGFEAMQTRAKERKMTYPYAVDRGSKLAEAFGATRTPEAFLFDAGGKLVYHGTIDDNYKEADKVTKNFLKDALAAVSEGKAVTTAETKSIGCGIKFKAKA